MRVVSDWSAVLRVGSLLASSVLAGGCAPSAGEPEARIDASPSSWQPVAEADWSETLVSQQERAVEAKDALMGQLVDRLQKVIQSSGPELAIGVCRDAAPEITQQVSADHGLKIGRTALRLRNPENQPPAWATDKLSSEVTEPHWWVSDSGELAGLLPIRLQTKCLMCHGPSDQIAPSILARLEHLYPEDQATGFAEGDLRGWFWVEVPSANDGAPSVSKE